MMTAIGWTMTIITAALHENVNDDDSQRLRCYADFNYLTVHHSPLTSRKTAINRTDLQCFAATRNSTDRA